MDNGGDAVAVNYRIEYATTTGGTWTAIPTSASTEHWEVSNSTFITDGEATSNISPGLTDPGGGDTFVAGELKDTGNQTGDIALSSTQFTEIEYSILATSTAVDGDLYFFRLSDAGATSTFTYSIYATATLALPAPDQLHYRWRNDDGGETDSTWSTTTVADFIDNDQDIAYVSLATPATGTIYVSFLEIDAEQVIFASSSDSGATWTTTTVDDIGTNVIAYVSLATPAEATP